MSRTAVAIASVGVVAVLGVATAVAVTAPDPVTVQRVIDGDTIDVLRNGETVRVRLLNIDTPETVDPDEPVECLGLEATDHLGSLLAPGTEVRLEHDDEKHDRYGRELAGVFVDNVLVNAEIARAGLGEPVLIEPNDKFYPDVLAAAQEAEQAAVGVFSPKTDCAFVADVDDVATAAQDAADQAQSLGVRDDIDTHLDVRDDARRARTLVGTLVKRSGRDDDWTVTVWRTVNPDTVAQRLDTAKKDASTAVETATRTLHGARERQEEQRVQAEAAAKAQAEAEARARAEAQREQAQPAPEPVPEIDSSNGGDSGYTGCRAYAPGGVTWKPIPCP